jgi:hypothetical protein
MGEPAWGSEHIHLFRVLADLPELTDERMPGSLQIFVRGKRRGQVGGSGCT